mmetsp:Transcript_30827/g.71095  ORF Transcript_30827/g.71095 Transcript_30827/m.71095 type:complete len:307 (+) Transcript_30827:215-1135(+)
MGVGNMVGNMVKGVVVGTETATTAGSQVTLLETAQNKGAEGSEIEGAGTVTDQEVFEGALWDEVRIRTSCNREIGPVCSALTSTLPGEWSAMSAARLDRARTVDLGMGHGMDHAMGRVMDRGTGHVDLQEALDALMIVDEVIDLTTGVPAIALTVTVSVEIVVVIALATLGVILGTGLVETASIPGAIQGAIQGLIPVVAIGSDQLTAGAEIVVTVVGLIGTGAILMADSVAAAVSEVLGRWEAIVVGTARGEALGFLTVTTGEVGAGRICAEVQGGQILADQWILGGVLVLQGVASAVASTGVVT